uniref:Uncharacterized protein MANES_04G084900 n=1 Tax=Rhizophora mucronata TaxID=61149 RepID=A0A2P2MUY3_RHIMU
MVAASSATHVLHHLVGPSPQPPLVYLFGRPLCAATAATATTTTTTTAKAVLSNHHKSALLKHSATALFSCLSPLPLVFPRSLSTSSLSFLLKSVNHSLTLEEEIEEEQEEQEQENGLGVEIKVDFDDDDDDDADGGYIEDTEIGSQKLELKDSNVVDGGSSRGSGLKLPNLTVKEKKELASYANGLGKKLKCQLVGKSGVTENVASSFVETLESNELLKVKVHRTCPGELEDVVQQLEEATGSVVVGQIGRTVILYRPSLTKLKAEEEKKRQARKVLVRKEVKLKPRSSVKSMEVKSSLS